MGKKRRIFLFDLAEITSKQEVFCVTDVKRELAYFELEVKASGNAISWLDQMTYYVIRRVFPPRALSASVRKIVT